jgi:hypothetical protein
MKWIISGSKGSKYSGSEKDGGFCRVLARLCFILVVTDIGLKVLRPMAGMMQQPVIGRSSHAVLESSWVGSGEPTVSKRRCPVRKRGTDSPTSGPVALRSLAVPINQPGTRRNPASAHWIHCTLEEL